MESRIAESLELSDGRTLRLREAHEGDMDAIRALYFKIYGGRYTLPEVTDPDKMKWAMHDPNYIWVLAEGEDGLLASSVIFVVDPRFRLGKTFAGVVDPSYRGHHTLVSILQVVLRRIMDADDGICDIIYAVVRTFTPRSFHQDLQSVGFVDMGVFPNVRKVRKYETQCLKVRFSPRALENRRRNPRLIPPAREIYSVAQQRLGLEPPRVEAIRLPRRSADTNVRFSIEKSAEVEWEYYKERDAGTLLFSFFPFHYPQLKLSTQDDRDVVYVHFLETDGHAAILGIKTQDPDNMASFLVTVADFAESLGIKYLELLVSAHDPLSQQIAYDANFLPCAYFPAVKSDTGDGLRQDYVITSCTFVPPHFRGLTLTPESRPYVQAFYKVYTARLWEEIQET